MANIMMTADGRGVLNDWDSSFMIDQQTGRRDDRRTMSRRVRDPLSMLLVF